MRDPYEVLGIDRKASAGDIKSAYRKLAKKLHPDANKNDPKAATRFAELNAANELLADEDKRKAFDRGEIDAEGKPRFQGFDGGFGRGPRSAGGAGLGPDANFESFNFGPEGFTRAGRRGRGGAAASAVSRTFSRRLSDAAPAAAPRPISSRRILASAPTRKPKCRCRCRMPPMVRRSACTCRTARMWTSRSPPGIHNGQTIRLKGQGMPGQHGAGDLLITVSIAPHPVFTLEGLDIRLDLPITLYEAALGAKVRVPTLDKPVEIAIPPSTSSGRTFRLKGKGFPAKSGRGDLLATVRIVLPENSDPELEALMKKWRSEKPYDPRKDL